MPFRLLSLLLLFAFTAVDAAPRVVSIKPIHGLVAGVMADVAEPVLLIDGAQSPHDFHLRPSQARELASADLVVWVGPELETSLLKTLNSVAADARRLTLMTAADMERLPVRSLKTRSDHDEGHEHEHDHGHQHEHHDWDSHLWLAPHNALATVRAVATALKEIDPANAEQYQGNAQDMVQRIQALDADLSQSLQAVKDRRFMVFHDAYQYLEHAYGLRSLAAVSISPERRPGARHLSQLRGIIKASGVACLFSEPQFKADVIEALVEGTSVRTAELDPLGAKLPAGEDAWFALMRGMQAALLDCLQAPMQARGN
ncbi:MAG: zinc ABC transporter substrate-binding protein [Gammaproteobacteria bacterium]